MNQHENFTPIHLREREKFERLKEQADIMRQFAEAVIAGKPAAHALFEQRCIGGREWMELPEGCLWQTSYEYRRKPEPTLEERNKAVRAEWEAMSLISAPDERHQTRSRGNSRFICECKYPHQSKDEWARANPDWADQMEYRIVELPSRLEPFTFATCPLGAHVAWKYVQRKASITTINGDCFTAGTWTFTFEQGLKCLDIIPDPSKPDERRPFGREVAP